MISLDFSLTKHCFPAFSFGKTLIRPTLSLQNFMTFLGQALGFSCSEYKAG